MIDELRCEVNLGVVRERVVLWVVLERTRRLVVDGDVDGGRGRTSAVVGPNCVGNWTGLQDCCNTPYRTVTCTEVETVW